MAAAAAAEQPSDIAMPSFMKRAGADLSSVEKVRKTADGGGGGGPPGGGGGGGSGGGDGGRDLRQTVRKMARLTLSHARQLAFLEAAVYLSFMLPEKSDDDLGSAMKAQGVVYDNESKALKEQQKAGQSVDFKLRGPPHVHLFIALLKKILSLTAGGGHLEDKKTYTIIREFWESTILVKEVSQIAELILHCRYKKARSDAEEKFGVICMAIERRSAEMVIVFEAVCSFMVLKGGAKKLTGPAPRGPLERDLGNFVGAKGGGKGQQ
jgi:hypothetical protein